MSHNRALAERELAVIFGADSNRPPWDDERDEPVRLPGDFPRRGADGPPQVSDPSPDAKIVKSGARKGRPYYLTYGRPSGYCEIIENTTNLTRWEQRVIAQGFGTDPTLSTRAFALMSEATSLVVRDQDIEWRRKLDGLVMAALRAGGGEMRADQGTAVHRLVELAHNELPLAGLLREIEQAGLDVDMPAEILRAMLDAALAKLNELGLEVLASEAKLVNDRHRVAGTTDLVLRLTRDLLFTMGDGKEVFLRAGTVIIGDYKCGRVDPKFIHSFLCQLFLYASSVGYDTEREVRTEFPGGRPPITTHGLIFHLPVVDALDGEIRCVVECLDLGVGKRIAECVLERNEIYDEARAASCMGEMTDPGASWTPATPVPNCDEASSTEVEIEPCVDLVGPEMTRQGLQLPTGERSVTDMDSTVVDDPFAGLNDEPIPVKHVIESWDEQVGDAKFRTYLERRVVDLRATDVESMRWFIAQVADKGIPKLSATKDHTNRQLRQIEHLVALAEIRAAKATAGEIRWNTNTPPVDAPDEGNDLTQGEIDAAVAFYEGLDGATRLAVDAWAKEAIAVGLSVQMSERRTERRLACLYARAAVALPDLEPDFIRAAIAFLTSEDWPLLPSIPLGAVIAAQSIVTLRSLCEIAASLPGASYEFDHRGLIRLAA